MALPELSGDRLTVVLEGEDDDFLEPSFRYERVRVVAEDAVARVPLAVLVRHSGGGRTTVELERPGSLVPDRLVLATDTPAFDRRVEVWDEGPGAAREPLAEGSVYRLPGQPAVEGLEVPLRPARGDRLRLVIEDGDSPPLAGLEARGAVPRPTLLFALPAQPGDGAGDGGDGAAAALYFGGGRAFRPRYDLEGLRPVPGRPVRGGAAQIAEFFAAPAGGYELLLGYPGAEAPRYELSRVRDVVLAAAAGRTETGPLEPNPAFRRASRWLTSPGLQGLLLWASLTAAVLVLAALTLRLARRTAGG